MYVEGKQCSFNAVKIPYSFAAATLLFLLLGTAINQKVVTRKPGPHQSSVFTALLFVLYGTVGFPIYTRVSLSLSVLYGAIYITLALLSYTLCPRILTPILSLRAQRVLCYLPSILESFFLPSQLRKCYAQLPETSAVGAQLSAAVSAFDTLIVREIMIPKVDVLALQEDSPVKDVLPLIIEEGYSRIPVYKKNIDHITGILLIKDLLTTPDPFNSPKPLISFTKPPFYAPEIKKAYALLQEFRQMHRHLAIIVNEYGFTEGIVTMEDIIEEFFGEISDEYDDNEDIPYKKVGSSWIIDSRMNISDAEELLDIHIPHGNYDTLGGHVFHKVGAVPQKGIKIHHENFDIEIMTCTDRSIGKLKITPRKKIRGNA